MRNGNNGGDATPSLTCATAAASAMDGKAHAATVTSCGTVANRSVASVTMPNVPSAPQNKDAKSYPALDLRARLPVLITDPSGNTTVNDSIHCFMVP